MEVLELKRGFNLFERGKRSMLHIPDTTPTDLLTCLWDGHRKPIPLHGGACFCFTVLTAFVMGDYETWKPSRFSNSTSKPPGQYSPSTLRKKTPSEDYFFYNLPKDEEATLLLLTQVLEYFSLICLQETTSRLFPLPWKYLHHSPSDPRFYKWLFLN